MDKHENHNNYAKKSSIYVQLKALEVLAVIQRIAADRRRPTFDLIHSSFASSSFLKHQSKCGFPILHIQLHYQRFRPGVRIRGFTGTMLHLPVRLVSGRKNPIDPKHSKRQEDILIGQKCPETDKVYDAG